MRKNKIAAGLLALILCIAMMPLEVSAWTDSTETLNNAEVNNESTDINISNESTEDPAPGTDLNDEEIPEVNKTKSLTQNGMKLSFRSSVLIDSPLGKESVPDRTQIKGQKRSMKVTWTAAPAPASLDGYIILRKTGRSKVYKQIAKVGRTRTSYTDKKAKKRNTEYAYTVVGYRKEGSDIRVSSCASWASGLTTRSRLKNGYKASISKSRVTLQSGETVKLTLKFSNSKKTHKKSSFRWYTNNKVFAKVNSKGVVTAGAPGTATVTGRMASGRDKTCKVTVVGAYKPSVPALETESATTESITLMWKKAANATSYDLYRSDDGGETYGEPVNVTKRIYTDTGLQEGQEYTYYIQARNDNNGYTELSDKSSEHKQQAVFVPHSTKVTGLPVSKSAKARKSYKPTVTVSAPGGRKAQLQLRADGEWVTRKKITMPEGYTSAKVEIDFPDTWWKEDKTKWRLYIPENAEATAYTSQVMTLTTERYYQNPKGYVQIKNKISKHGYDYYTSPVLVDNTSTRKDHVEAMIKTAYKYKGDPYANRWSRAPRSGGVDCSGLVMQACYGAGVDLWPSNPHRHRYGPARYEWESREIAKMKNLKTVSYGSRKRGDLIFFCSSSGVVIHVAIYLGDNKIIHSTTVGGHVIVSGMGGGAYGSICKVKRVFIS